MDADSDAMSQRASVTDRIAAEPRLSAVLRKLLVFCVTPRSLDEIEAAVVAYPEMRISLFSVTTVLAWLVDAGGIEELQPEAFPDSSDAKRTVLFQTTLDGTEALNHYDASHLLVDLVESSERYHPVYVQVLKACMTPRETSYFDHLLEGCAALENPKLYPGFFIDKLEKAGGLAWDDGWSITDAGRALLASLYELK